MSRPYRTRIRTFKPEGDQDERNMGVSRDARLLYHGIVKQADDEGRGSANPALLRANVFPYDDDVTAPVLTAWMGELEAAGLVENYAVGKRSYYAIVSWAEDQRVDKPTASKLPPPPSARTCLESSKTSREPSRHVEKAPAGPDQDQDQDQDRIIDLDPREARGERSQGASEIEQTFSDLGLAVDPRKLDGLLREFPGRSAADICERLRSWHDRDPIQRPVAALKTILTSLAAAPLLEAPTKEDQATFDRARIENEDTKLGRWLAGPVHLVGRDGDLLVIDAPASHAEFLRRFGLTAALGGREWRIVGQREVVA